MSEYNENNGYGEQTPPDNRRPDYTYKWNGSEYSSNNRRHSGRGFAIIAVVILLIGVLVVSTVIGYAGTQRGTGGENTVSETVKPEQSSSGGTEEPGAALREGGGKKTEISVPDFKPDIVGEKEETDLTVIYETAAKACCTVKVTPKSGAGYVLGSGFVIDAEGGYIATNHHVIENGKSIKVVFYDGTEYAAELVGSDATTDLAVLRINADNLVKLPIGSSDELKVGERVIAIGTPYSEEFAGTMTVGYISGIARNVEITNDYGKVTKVMTLIQTDCAINPGNSGGPLIDMNGCVVGINSLKIASEEYEGMGFAIPITSATEIFKKLIAGEEVGDSAIASATPRLGITVYTLKYGFETFKLTPRCEYPEGILVGTIEADTAVYAAGLELFDIITEFNGTRITTLDDLTSALSKCKAGQTATLKLFRFNRTLTSGEEVTITFKLEAS
ncbi:MAG: trypsin-like peptidase domain-containing protein [Clostridia bacterium]|nr:trypsin-like peptidase domain-containing protein [Clostridia bacterium]MBR5746288.1 trypsin-like peptidase domain-containing protein [Clostridia bacterium]